jgi:integrase/recombinase XerD
MNKPSRPLLVGPLLQSFFSEHLCNHRDASIQTIASYRDTFRLLLSYVQQTTGIEPSALRITDLEVTVILAFLAHLEEQRHNSVRSRNIRLAAIRSFFRLVALRDPDSVGLATQVLAIPIKRCDKPLVGYLTQPEMEAILAVPDLSLWIGQRDHALLLTMYNSGGRVSEIIGLSWQQVRFGTTTYLDLNGKGRKERSVPLWPKTAKVLHQWRKRQPGSSTSTIFPSLRGNVLTRDSVNHLLREIVQLAIPACRSLATKRVTPHLIRHGTAMHLLQSGVDITVIALWLGHEDFQTTHVYLQADLAMKEKALNKLAPPETKVARFKPRDEKSWPSWRRSDALDYVGSEASKSAPHHHLLNRSDMIHNPT